MFFRGGPLVVGKRVERVAPRGTMVLRPGGVLSFRRRALEA